MPTKPDDQPDPKEIENRSKDAKAVLKVLEQCKKQLAGMAALVKELVKKSG